MTFYGYADAMWPTYEAPTYCEYCTRQHRSSATNCDGCGAPRTAPRAAAAGEAFDDLLDITTHGGRDRRLLNARTGQVMLHGREQVLR